MRHAACEPSQGFHFLRLEELILKLLLFGNIHKNTIKVGCIPILTTLEACRNGSVNRGSVFFHQFPFVNFDDAFVQKRI